MSKKVAVVTGASSGIGLAIANYFLENNIKVYNWDIQETDESRSNGSHYQYTDIKSVENIEDNVRYIKQQQECLDIVVCNSGTHKKNTLETITEEDWDYIQNTNVKGVVFTAKHCLPLLKASNNAKIVIMGSDQCFIAKSESLAYGASKGSIGQLTKYLAMELAEHSICVNTVCPATIDTPLARTAFTEFADAEFGGSIDKAFEWEASQYPLKKIGKPEDVAELVYYLSTFKNNFTTGSLYKIDGGLTVS